MSSNRRYPERADSKGAISRTREIANTAAATTGDPNAQAMSPAGTPSDGGATKSNSRKTDETQLHDTGVLNAQSRKPAPGLPVDPRVTRLEQATVPTTEIPLSEAEIQTRLAYQQWADRNPKNSKNISAPEGGGDAGTGGKGSDTGDGSGETGAGFTDARTSVECTRTDVGVSGTGGGGGGRGTDTGVGGTGRGTATGIGGAGTNIGTGVETAGRGVGTGSSAVGRGLETGVGATGGGAGTGVGDVGRGGQLDKDRRKEADRQAMDARKKREEESARQAEEARRRQEEAKRKQQEEERQWLQNEIIRLDQENRLAAQDIQDLEVKNESLKVANNNLGHQWSKLSAELDAQRKVLNATRAFASREGTVDAQALIQLFNDLNASIGDYAFEVLRGLNDKAESRSLDGDDFANIIGLFRTSSNDPNDSTVDPNIGKFLERLEKMKDDLTPMDIIDPIIQFTLCRHLYYQIFMPFAPSLTVENSDALHDIYTKMRRSEPQERSARWRSITYKQALNMQKPGALHKFIEDETNAFVKLVYDILNALNKGEEAKPPTDLFKAAGDIFQAAMKVQERAKTEYVSFDYEVTFYRREYQPSREIVDGKEKTILKMMRPSFDPSLMEASQGAKGTTPKSVWMTVGLGMIALKGVRTEGGMKSEMSTPVKAKVIGDNWDPNA